MLQLAAFKVHLQTKGIAGIEFDAQHFAVFEPDTEESGIPDNRQAQVTAVEGTIYKPAAAHIRFGEIAVVKRAGFVNALSPGYRRIVYIIQLFLLYIMLHSCTDLYNAAHY